MSWQEHVTGNWFHGVEPEFPYAWTFSSQRYVPRPRPVARIILPSHQRVSSPVGLEVSSHVTFSRSESLQSLLRFAHEGDSLASIRQDSRIHKFFSLYERLSESVAAVKEKIVDFLAGAWSLVRKSFRLLKKVVQALKRFGQTLLASD